MRILAICKLLIPALLLASLFVEPTAAQDTAYRRVLLVHNISIEIPSHWKILSQETRKNLGAVGEAITKNAGVDGPSGKKIGLLAVNATPDPTGAMIRVSVTSPPDYTQADLAAATPADLKDLGTEMQNMFRTLEASGGPKIIEVQPVRIEKLNNYRVLVMPYVRAGINGPSPWQVTQYKIPVSERLIEITLSHRQSDAVLWRPILERVKRSAQF
ncbi:MAG: hypothetical protein Q8O45_06100 [Desulfurivibrionaceae bacterium]|nr:hypothetical protein [Desulfurivibrionaceae bacterium]